KGVTCSPPGSTARDSGFRVLAHGALYQERSAGLAISARNPFYRGGTIRYARDRSPAPAAVFRAGRRRPGEEEPRARRRVKRRKMARRKNSAEMLDVLRRMSQDEKVRR